VTTRKEKSWHYVISGAAADETDVEFVLKSPEDHKRWSKLIQKCIETRQQDKVFGRSLDEVVVQEADGLAVSPITLPKLIVAATDYLTLTENSTWREPAVVCMRERESR
jgi:hypothetical protein